MTKMSARPQVTITLGSIGQVVTKGGKRSRYRFGDNGHNFSHKRHLGNGIKWNPAIEGSNVSEGTQYARNDLRLKLMRKRKSRQLQNVVAERDRVDSQRRLSKAIHHPTSSYIAPHRSDTNGIPYSRQFTQNEIANDSRQVDSSGRFYSSHIMRGPGVRSPDRIMKSSTRLSPPRSFDGLQRATWLGPADVARGGRFLNNEVRDSSMQTGSSHVTVNTTSQAGNLVSRLPPTGGTMQKVPHMGEETATIASFLRSLGLGKYAIHFQAEEVDMSVLKQMRDIDLKEMGIPMGPRKKILLALFPRLKQPTMAPQH